MRLQTIGIIVALAFGIVATPLAPDASPWGLALGGPARARRGPRFGVTVRRHPLG